MTTAEILKANQQWMQQFAQLLVKERNQELSSDYLVRAIPLRGVANARQLGDYTGQSGRKIKKDVLIRSANLSTATDEDLKLLNQYGIKAVIDLRNTMEKDASPDRPVDGSENVWYSVLEGSVNAIMGKMLANPQTLKIFFDSPDTMTSLVYMGEGTLFQQFMEGIYLQMVTDESSVKVFSDIFQYILSLNGAPILWHCSQGKDRCGMMTVLLLLALGVDRETIVKDFSLSNVFYTDLLIKLEKLAREMGDGESVIHALQAIIGVCPAYMEKALDYIFDTYKVPENYLKEKLSLSDKDIEQLREWYLC